MLSNIFSDIFFSTKFWYTCIILLLSVYFYAKYSLKYWQRKKIYSPPSKSWLGHLLEDESTSSIGIKLQQMYLEHKKKPVIGLNLFCFLKQLVVNDLDLVKNVISKDYSYFEGHGFKSNKSKDPLGQHLFNLEGQEWKRLRVKLTPTFTSSKMKYMFDTVYKCNLEMIEYLKDEIKDGNDVEVKEVIAKLGTDVISSTAFGLESNSFKDPNSAFRKMGKKIFETTTYTKLFDLFTLVTPEIMQSIPLARQPNELTTFFTNIVKDTIQYREENNIKRNDFLQLLIEMKNSEKTSEYHITLEEIIPQVFVFFIAGFETSSTAVQYTLLELAKNKHVRDKLVADLDEAVERNNGEITYEFVYSLTCLNEVVDETLRIYPPLPILTRRCTKDYKVPDSDIVIEKGTLMFIPVLGIHHDPDIYPEPEKFIPERFSAQNKNTRHNYAHIPFGEGPRICIGNRFAYIQSKLALLAILLHFNVELSPNTELPLKYDPNALLLHTEGNMILRFSPRHK